MIEAGGPSRRHAWLGLGRCSLSARAARPRPSRRCAAAGEDVPSRLSRGCFRRPPTRLALEAFRQGLRDLGYVEGQNIVIEYRHEGGGFGAAARPRRRAGWAKTGRARRGHDERALAVRRATTTIPIVFMGVTDPVTAGLVESLSRPGGNTTGITNIAAILTGKRLELLKETIPSLSRVAVLWDPQAPGSVPQWQESQLRARELGLQLPFDGGQQRRWLRGGVQRGGRGAQHRPVGDPQPSGQLQPEADCRSGRQPSATIDLRSLRTTRRTAA